MIQKEILKISLVALPMALAPAFNMLFLVMVAREADSQVYGSLSYVLALMALLAGFSDLGLRDFFLSKAGLLKKYASARSLFYISNLVFFTALFLQWFFLLRDDKVIVSYLFLFIVLEGYALSVLYKMVYYKLQLKNSLPYFSKYDALVKASSAVVKISVYFTTKNIFLSLFFSGGLLFLCYMGWLHKISGQKNLEDGFELGVVDSFKFLIMDWKVWSVFSLSFLSFFLYFGADKLIVQATLGMEELAVYSAAMAFMAIGQIAVSVLWSLYMPRLSRGEVLWSYRKFIIILLALGVLAFAFYQAISYCVFPYIYPEEYLRGAYVLSLASLYFIFRFPNVVVEIFYIVDGRYFEFVKMRLLFGVFSVILSLVLLRVIGIFGPVLALVLSEMLLMIGSIIKRRSLDSCTQEISAVPTVSRACEHSTKNTCGGDR